MWFAAVLAVLLGVGAVVVDGKLPRDAMPWAAQIAGGMTEAEARAAAHKKDDDLLPPADADAGDDDAAAPVEMSTADAKKQLKEHLEERMRQHPSQRWVRNAVSKLDKKALTKLLDEAEEIHRNSSIPMPSEGFLNCFLLVFFVMAIWLAMQLMHNMNIFSWAAVVFPVEAAALEKAVSRAATFSDRLLAWLTSA
eukprot:PLAT6228.1.p2 GENE.PLAT6228.1~~PLAT6228.1.p2  ORF type:complete len:214 (+),score=90.33 PLAT6228.1:58-642(+)